MTFDTTASNSGLRKGAAKLLEEELGRKLLYLACRHHIYELQIGAVWQELLGEVKGPDNTMFKHLRAQWSSIDKTEPFILTLDESDPDHQWLIELRTRTLTDLRAILGREQEYLPRADYREVAELTMVVLGETPPRAGFQFSYPGAISQARWMAVNIYTLKMFMFQDQLGYSEEVREKLLRVVMYISLLYTRMWMSSVRPADAPSNDLQLYKDLLQYEEHDAEVAAVARAKLSNHKWYLTQELVPLALFSKHTTDEEKISIVSKIKSHPKPSAFNLGRPKFPMNLSAETSLADLTGPQSHATLELLGINIENLLSPPSAWESNESFVEAKRVVDKLKVSNDVAERHVKMASDYSSKITADKDQRQCLFQMVEKHRKAYPGFKKKILCA